MIGNLFGPDAMERLRSAFSRRDDKDEDATTEHVRDKRDDTVATTTTTAETGKSQCEFVSTEKIHGPR